MKYSCRALRLDVDRASSTSIHFFFVVGNLEKNRRLRCHPKKHLELHIFVSCSVISIHSILRINLSLLLLSSRRIARTAYKWNNINNDNHSFVQNTFIYSKFGFTGEMVNTSNHRVTHWRRLTDGQTHHLPSTDTTHIAQAHWSINTNLKCVFLDFRFSRRMLGLCLINQRFNFLTSGGDGDRISSCTQMDRKRKKQIKSNRGWFRLKCHAPITDSFIWTILIIIIAICISSSLLLMFVLVKTENSQWGH